MEDAPYAYTVPAFMILARTAVLKMNVAIGAGPVAGRPARTRRRTPSRRRLAGREWERACGAARCPLLEDDTGQRTNIQLGLRTARHRGGSARRGASPPRACAGVRPAVPWRFIWVRMRPTHGSGNLDVHWRCRTPSLSLPQRG